MALALALGALRCGQCPTLSMMRSVLRGIVRCMYWPTDWGAMMSSLHCRINEGVVT